MPNGKFEETVHLYAGEKRAADYSSLADRLDLRGFLHRHPAAPEERPPARRCRFMTNEAPTSRAARARPPLRRRCALALWPAVLTGLACLGLVAQPAGSAFAAKQPTPAQKEAELRKLNQRIEQVRKSVNADVAKRDKLSVQLRDAELGVQSARSELDSLRAQRIAAESRIRELEREQAKRDRELDLERSALAGELRTAYVNGREEQLKLLLNQEDPTSFGRTLAYYGYFGRARLGRIDSIREQLEHLALVREKISAETARLQSLETQQEQQVAALNSSLDARQRAVGNIDRQIKSRGGELSRLQAQAGSVEKVLAELRKALARSSASPDGRKWPSRRRSSRSGASCPGPCRTARCSPGSASPGPGVPSSGRAC